MNSLERKEIRYKRRKEKRNNINSNRYNVYNAFTFSNVLYYADKCCLNVGYKRSTTLFKLHKFSIVGKVCTDIKNNTYKVGKTYRFQIKERGKVRDIDAPFIKDRLIHKVISDEILIPLYDRHLIYNNGASQEGKGFMFTLYRLKYILSKFYNKYKDGYVVLIDFSKFFENCSHEIIHNIHKKYISDDYTIKVIEDYLFIVKGIALGLEIAQREAIILPNLLDHYIENNTGNIVRYMDDTIFLCKTKDEAIMLLNNYKKLANKLNIKINDNKTKIIKLSNKFRYCKWNYIIDRNNKIIMIPYRKTIYRQRRKIKKMYKLYLNNKIDYKEIETIKKCFCAYLDMGNTNKYIKYLKKNYL